jgi:hypothetical protein
MNHVAANEVTSNVPASTPPTTKSIGEWLSSSRKSAEANALQEGDPREPHYLHGEDVGDPADETLLRLLIRSLGANEYFRQHESKHVARGCMRAIGAELEVISRAVIGKDNLNWEEISDGLFRLSQRCEGIAEIDRRVADANAKSKAPPARFPNLELTLDFHAHDMPRRAWSAQVVALARALEGEDVRPNQWVQCLDAIAARLNGVTLALLLGEGLQAERSGTGARKVVSIASRQSRPKIGRRVAASKKKGGRS